jgi:hypothetical protein
LPAVATYFKKRFLEELRETQGSTFSTVDGIPYIRRPGVYSDADVDRNELDRRTGSRNKAVSWFFVQVVLIRETGVQWVGFLRDVSAYFI